MKFNKEIQNSSLRNRNKMYRYRLGLVGVYIELILEL